MRWNLAPLCQPEDVLHPRERDFWLPIRGGGRRTTRPRACFTIGSPRSYPPRLTNGLGPAGASPSLCPGACRRSGSGSGRIATPLGSRGGLRQGKSRAACASKQPRPSRPFQLRCKPECPSATRITMSTDPRSEPDDCNCLAMRQAARQILSTPGAVSRRDNAAMGPNSASPSPRPRRDSYGPERRDARGLFVRLFLPG
jgi:hypothetical protein